MREPPLQQQTAASVAQPYYTYTGSLLAGLSVAWGAAMILMFTDPSVWTSAQTATSSTSSFGVTGSIGVFLLLCVVVAVLLLDWRGFTTVHGAIKWGRMKVWQRLIVGYFFIGLSMFVLGIYFFQAFQTYRQAMGREPLERQRRTAELEANLGIMPATEGTCRVCHKPMHVGADYCAYCGAPAVEKPRICPACATVALPDARFCPKCRTPLSPSS